MSATLIIWMDTNLSAPWYWNIQGATQGDGEGRAVSDEDKANLAQLGAKDVFAVIAGQSVRVLPHDIPKLNAKERLSAAGFAIEEAIGSSLNGQHLVLGDKDDARIAIISKGVMEAIIEALNEAGLSDARIYADFDILSSADKAFILGTRVIHAKPLGYTLDKAWHDPAQKAEAVSGPDVLLNFLDSDKAINLRQNAFAPRRSFAVSGTKINLQTLGRMAALFLLCGVTWLGFQGASARAKGQEAAFIKTETSRLYSETTGQAAPPNPALAATRAIQSGPKQSAGFLTLSKILFDAVAQTDGIIIETLQYDTSRAELSLRIIYPGFASTTDLEQSVSKFGGVFEAGGVREQGGQFIGDATLRLGGGR